MELEQIIGALINNNERLNTLLDNAGNPTPRFQRILSVYDEYVLDVFYELVDADAVDCSYIVERIGRMAEDNEWENGTEASMIVNFLTDIADEINVNINEDNKAIKNDIEIINEDADEYSNYTDESLLKEIVEKYGKKTILDILNVFDAMIRHV